MNSEKIRVVGECGGPELSEGLIDTPAKPIVIDSETWYKESVKQINELLKTVTKEFK